MQPDGDDHRMGAPPVHFPHDAEWNMFPEAHDIRIGVLESRPVVKHQQKTSERQYEKQKKAKSAHTPGIPKADAMFLESNGM